jgi:hypothetical protein
VVEDCTITLDQRHLDAGKLAAMWTDAQVAAKKFAVECKVEVAFGDLWRIGDHRLLCGDSTVPADVARVMGLPPAEGQRISNLVPEAPDMTFEKAFAQSPDFQAAYDADENVRRVVDGAKELENHARTQGIHAAGVVIATPVVNRVTALQARDAPTPATR